MSESPFGDQIKNSVKEAADIVEVVGEVVALRRSASRWVGLCPFHSEKTPSFSVNPQGQFFHCFGCGEHGDVFSFVMKYHHMEFPEALKVLAQKYGIPVPERQLSAAQRKQLQKREQLYEANEAAALLYQHCLQHSKFGAVARSYLEQRGVPAKIIEHYRLGCAPDPDQVGWSYATDQLRNQGISQDSLSKAGLSAVSNRGGYYDRFRSRIMFPIIDMTGRVAAFGGRILGDGAPKYMNSPESPVFDKGRLLFGLHQHRETIRRQRRALIVEGNFDLLLLAAHGVDCAVAPLGTALTRDHIRSLRPYSLETILLFDADAAGLKAVMRCIPYFLAEQVEARVALLPAGHDPDSFIRAEGSAAVIDLMENARPLAEFAFDRLADEHGLTLAGKNKIIAELKQLLKEATDAEQRGLMASHFSAKLGVSPEYFITEKVMAKRPAMSTAAAQPQGLAALSRKEKQFVDFLILHPHSIEELEKAGLDVVFKDSALLHFVQLVKDVARGASCRPEDVLEQVVEEHDRTYIVRVLTRIAPSESEQPDHARRECEELVQWLQKNARKQTAASLQEKINQAERLGDTHLLMELLHQKQILQQK
ncbi:DNA primase [Desulfobulbus oligotrophicus]|uniref:DNA primase n=1 Tax=Desulfobulbus oligotrophicus TaxID=1909699 RepID=A0A7T5VCZ5_9BACT|nr:DNA primase [Desulfobulbus oligotrophicus]QQG65516.1 DNA primase [Desulfobulbus oligotrophicus]